MEEYDLDVFRKPGAIAWYLLGAFMTDGTVCNKTNGCVLAVKDRDWAEAVMRSVCLTRDAHHVERHDMWSARFHHPEIKKWFVDNGCVPNKTLTLEYPTTVPDKFFFDFVRGAIDGDGNIGSYKMNRKSGKGQNSYQRSVRISSASERFVFPLSEELKKRGVFSSVTSRIPKPTVINGRRVSTTNVHYSLNVSASNAGKLLKACYYEGNPIELARKGELAREIAEWYDRKEERRRTNPSP